MQKQNKYTIATTYKSNPFLEYFDQFSEIQTRPKNLQSLSDGMFLIEMSQLIKDFIMRQDVEENPKTFAQKLSNLKILYRSIQSFWSDVLGIEIEGQQIDFVEIARSNNLQEIENLLQLFIKTAVQAENKDFFIEKVLQTTSQTQEFLKKIIEKVFKTDTRESPRKEKEKRMYDKILELDHENDRLQSILYQICEQKMQLQGKIKQLSDKIAEQSKQLENYQCILHEDMSTPQKVRMMGFPDTSDRKQSLIDSLRKQIADMAISHERQTQALCSQIERISRKNQEFEKMKNQLTLSRQIIDSHKQYMQQVKSMQSELSHFRAEDMNKNNHIEYMKQKQQQANKMIVDLQTALTSSRAQIERKNIQIGELITKLQDIQKRFSPRKQHGNNLYFDFPDIINTEADAYIETNRNLRQQLQRTRKRLQQIQSQLTAAQSSLQTLQGCQVQNRKLRQMVLQLNSYRGQQNQLLVSSLYHMRRMVQARLC